MSLTIDLGERTLTGTSKGDGIRWRQYGLTWSRSRGCWVWPRTTRPQTVEWRAAQIATEHGAEIIGEAAAVEIDADERDERIAERHDRAADRALAERDSAEETFRRIGDMIPVGQPILVGHHSERRHRRDLARMDRSLSTIVSAGQDARDHERKADAARRRIDARAEQAVAEPVPLEVLAPGFTVQEWYKDGRRRSWVITKVNRKTVSWASHGCSGKIDADRIFRAWDLDGHQVWPEHEDMPRPQR